VSVNKAIKIIRSGGDRITNARRKIIEIIIQSTKPLSAPKIQEILKEQGVVVNKSTIYRELSFLVEYEIIQQVKLTSSVIHYESAFLPHHHYFICNKCGEIENVKCDGFEVSLQNLEKKILKKGFSVKKHNLEFLGICTGCS